MDIVDIGIIAVGLSLLPMLPDLLANLMTAFLPRNSKWAATARKASKEVRRVTNSIVSRVLMFLSVVLPSLALYFERDMLSFRGTEAWSIGWVVELLVLTLLLIIVESFYFLTLFTDPGFLPLKPEESDNPDGQDVCKKCGVVKPERAHHCSVCGRCVLRMDHHCPFTNCCVGLHNERFFFLWLFTLCECRRNQSVVANPWTPAVFFAGPCGTAMQADRPAEPGIGSAYSCVQSWRPFSICIVTGIMEGIDAISETDLGRCTVAGKASYLFLPAIGIFLFISVLLGWHILLIATNQTTIEFLRYRLEPLVMGSKREGPKIESRGIFANFQAVLFPSDISH